jgi:hypothetical protein
MTAHEMRAYRGPTRVKRTRAPRTPQASGGAQPPRDGCRGKTAALLAVFGSAVLSVAQAVSTAAGWLA